MSEQAAFLAAIRENPACDASRLAYADWLMDHGEPFGHDRGQFIRFQHALGGTSEYEFPQESDVWPYREWPDSGHTITRGQSRFVGGPSCVWRRGFIETVRLPLVEFWRRVRVLFTNHPVTAVELTDRRPHHDGPKTFEWLIRSDERLPEAAHTALPADFRPFLRGYRTVTRNQKGKRVRFTRGTCRFAYPTEAAARAALSRCCVDYGRSLVGLPRLPEPAVAGVE